MERLNKARRSSKDVPSVDGTPRTSTVRSANLSRLKECLRSGILRMDERERNENNLSGVLDKKIGVGIERKQGKGN